MIKPWIWSNIGIPALAGFFFALGHFFFYMLGKTKPLKALEDYITADSQKEPAT